MRYDRDTLDPLTVTENNDQDWVPEDELRTRTWDP
jgi:hypothetical protein